MYYGQRPQCLKTIKSLIKFLMRVNRKGWQNEFMRWRLLPPENGFSRGIAIEWRWAIKILHHRISLLAGKLFGRRFRALRWSVVLWGKNTQCLLLFLDFSEGPPYQFQFNDKRIQTWYDWLYITAVINSTMIKQLQDYIKGIREKADWNQKTNWIWIRIRKLIA